MSAEMMQKAFEVSASDKRLTPADKLVLLRWAWRTIDPASPYEIKFRTVARELGLSRNAVKASVRRLCDCGYLMPVSVKVVAGSAFQVREGGQAVTPCAKSAGGQSVTRGGSASDPQKGQPVTPFKKKREKRAQAPAAKPAKGQAASDCEAAPSRARSAPAGRVGSAENVRGWRGVSPDTATPFERLQLQLGRSVLIGGELLKPGTPDHEAARAALCVRV